MQIISRFLSLSFSHIIFPLSLSLSLSLLLSFVYVTMCLFLDQVQTPCEN